MATHFYRPDGLERGPWYWKDQGGDQGLMLLTAHHGSRVVLCVGGRDKGSLQTRGQDGRLTRLTMEHPLVRALGELPESMLMLVEVQMHMRELEKRAGPDTAEGRCHGILALRIESALRAAGYVEKEA